MTIKNISTLVDLDNIFSLDDSDEATTITPEDPHNDDSIDYWRIVYEESDCIDCIDPERRRAEEELRLIGEELDRLKKL